MTTRSPSAYFLSAFLHTFVIVGMLLFALMMRPEEKDTPHIFELVAGEGNNFAATEASALGTEGGIQVEMPEVPAPTPRPAPPEPVIVPAPAPTPAPTPTPAPVPKAVVQPAPVAPPPAPKAPVPKAAPLVRPETREEAIRRRIEEQKQAKMTEEEFRRQNPGAKSSPAPKAPAPAPIRTTKIDAAGIAKGVVGGSTTNRAGGAGGNALSRAESDSLDAYAQLIIQRIRLALESARLSDLLQVRVAFNVSANGAISGARVLTSSGSAEFDRAVVGAFQTIPSIGPPPTNRAESFSVTIRMRER